MKRRTFEQILRAALEAQFAAGDWRDDGASGPYERLHRRCLRTRRAVLKAHKERRK